jgi:hypothetical protein
MVLNKEGSWCTCLYLHALNKMTIKDKFHILIIDDLSDELEGAYFFTKLDLLLGYHQIWMKEVNIPKTDLRTHEGNYEFLVIYFVLCNAPYTFQSLMNKLLKPTFGSFFWFYVMTSSFTTTLGMFVVDSYALGTGSGTVLTQDGIPLAFIS